MKKFDFTAQLRGLHKVEITKISFDTNSRGEYIDIEVKSNNKVYHIFNNINENTENYVVAQLCNAGNQVGIKDCSSDELLKQLVGKTVEVTVTDNGFAIANYRQLEEPKEV